MKIQAISSLLAQFAGRGIRFSADEGGLACAPEGALTSAEEKTIAEHEADIILFLRAKAAARFPLPTTPALSFLPSQTQSEWWAWRKVSPHPLSGEKLSIIKPVSGRTADEISACVTLLVSRHSALRSSLREGPDGPDLTLNMPEAVPVEIEHLSVTDPASAETQAKARAEEFIAGGFTVRDPWLTKAKIIVLGPDDALLVLVFHHLIVDGPSIALVQADLEKLLAEDLPPDASMATGKLQLVDYAEAERLWFRDDAAKPLIQYWRKWLEEQPPLRAPKGNPLTWQHGINVANYFSIPTGVMDMVQTLSLKFQSIPFLFFLTVYALSLSRWSGQASVAIRCVGSLRGTHAPASMVGNLVTADAIAVSVLPENDFRATLQAVTANYLAATQMRIPNLLRFPAHPAFPGLEDEFLSGAAAASLNFLSAGYRRNGKDAASMSDAFAAPAWPPAITRGKAEEWPALLWPVILRLYDPGSEAKGMFEFNEVLVAAREQADLMAIFFRVLEDCVANLGTREPESREKNL